MKKKGPVTHGETGTPTYVAWQNMMGRCFRRGNKSYKHYGGKGVTVCQEWRGRGGYQRFLAAIGHRPSPKHTVDRIDPSGNYEPGNVRWATRAVQGANKRNTIRVKYRGKLVTLADLAREYGMYHGMLHYRIVEQKMSVAEALKKRHMKPRAKVEYDGKLLTIGELSRLTKVSHALLYNRIVLKNWPVKTAVAKPSRKAKK